MSTFDYHKPTEEQVVRMQVVREGFKQLHRIILEATPSSRERSLAITNLEQAAMWLNKAVIFEEVE